MARAKPRITVAKDDPIPRLHGVPSVEPLGGTVELFDVEQGSNDWLMMRLGMPTASNFGVIMASGEGGGESKERRKLLNVLAGEILTGEVSETYSNEAMRRGKEMEPEACAHYAFTRDEELEPIGFAVRTMPRGQRVGCSPDRKIVGKPAGLETKTMRPDLLIDLASRGTFPSEHRAQCQGTLWVLDWEWLDLMVFYRGMPVAPTWRLVRDEHYIRQISDAVEVFEWELRKLIERVRNMGRG